MFERMEEVRWHRDSGARNITPSVDCIRSPASTAGPVFQPGEMLELAMFGSGDSMRVSFTHLTAVSPGVGLLCNRWSLMTSV